MPGAFFYDNVAKGAVLTSAQANVPSMPLANLQDAQPRRRARLNAASATIDMDLLAALPVDCVGLLSMTLSTNATIRVRLANVGSFATVLADTGTINAEAQDEAQGNVVLVFPAPVTARYLRIDLTDGAAAFMARAAAWVETSGIPQDMSQEVTEAITNTFQVARKLLGGGGGEEPAKKA